MPNLEDLFGLSEDQPIKLHVPGKIIRLCEASPEELRFQGPWVLLRLFNRDGDLIREIMPRQLAEWELFVIGTDPAYRPDIARGKIIPIAISTPEGADVVG